MNTFNPQFTAQETYVSLSEHGYSKSLIKTFLPDWWSDDLIQTGPGAFEFAAILRRKLGVQLKFDQSGHFQIGVSTSGSKFKRRSDTLASDLNVAANLGRSMAIIAAHSCINPFESSPDSVSAEQVRGDVLEMGASSVINFESLVRYCWSTGIPVIYLDYAPQGVKRMAGMITLIDKRPVIVLGHQYKQSSKQLFILAHELGHFFCGHISDNQILVDEELNNLVETINPGRQNQKDIEESEADNFATTLLRGASGLSLNFRTPVSAAQLAAAARALGKRENIDPGHLILSYAYDTNEWLTANQAIAFFPNSNEALDVLKTEFIEYSDLERLGQESRDHILDMHGISR